MNYPIVYSHGRSGTHWFCSLLQKWFWPDATDLTGVVTETRDPFHGAPTSAVPWMGLFGGHYHSPLNPVVRQCKRKAIYLYRDGQAVMASAARRNGRPLAEELRRQLFYSPAANPHPEGVVVTPPMLWAWATSLWHMESYRGDALIVTYEVLVDVPGLVREDIASYLEIDPHPSACDVDTKEPIGFAARDPLTRTDHEWAIEDSLYFQYQTNRGVYYARETWNNHLRQQKTAQCKA